MNATKTADVPAVQQPKLLASMAAKYGLEPKIFEATMRTVAMPRDKDGKPNFTDEEFVACLIVANKHDLNPITREIYFMKAKNGQVIPIVAIDGWIKKMNEHPAFDGFEFEDHLDNDGGLYAITCIVHRKDRSHPTKITEYLAECQQDSTPWKKAPARMLRHRTLTQAARYAVGLAGVMDYDEFMQWQTIESMKDITPKSNLKKIPPEYKPLNIDDIPDYDESQDPDDNVKSEEEIVEDFASRLEQDPSQHKAVRQEFEQVKNILSPDAQQYMLEILEVSEKQAAKPRGKRK